MPVITTKTSIVYVSLQRQAVCFDVDSTVIAEEGIDVLADFCGAAEAVADLTNRCVYRDIIQVGRKIRGAAWHVGRKREDRWRIDIDD